MIDKSDSREVRKEDLGDLVNEYPYFEISCKDNIGINEMFEDIFKKIKGDDIVVSVGGKKKKGCVLF